MGESMTIPIPVTLPPLPENTVLVEILNPSTLASAGMVQFATVNATISHNAVGSYSILMPYSDAMWDWLNTGDFLVRINWRGLFTFGGKCEQPVYSDSIPGSSGGSSGISSSYAGPFITLSGADYLAVIANRICFPDPTVAWSAQKALSQAVVVNAPLETAIKYYVGNNVGPGAIPSRQHPLLGIAADQKRGPNVTYSVNFTSGQSLNMMDVIRALISQVSSKMGVRVTQNPQDMSKLLFDVYMPADKTGTAWFAEELGNLTAINFSLTDPTCTDALVQGATPMSPNTAPTFIEQTATSTMWTKVEQYTDDSAESIPANLATTAANALYTGSMGPNLNATAIDTPYCVFGQDYFVGDIVSVSVRAATANTPEVVYQDVVSSATLTCDPSQTPIMNVVPTIGNATDPSANAKTATGQLQHRIQVIEKQLAKRGLR
jgi:hypothetical protein